MGSLEDLYREVILDHYRSPRNRGELDSPPAIKSEGKNPVCGDELTLYLLENNDIIEDVKIAGSGCSISMASASMMSSAIKGQSVQRAREIIQNFKEMMHIHEANLENEISDQEESRENNLGELDALRGVVKFPVRIKCAVLAFNTLENALNDGKAAKIATSE
ncbi:MAG: SUF system NifU family Fe-S cluster assembly protein [Acidimicrobiia bacterium]